MLLLALRQKFTFPLAPLVKNANKAKTELWRTRQRYLGEFFYRTTIWRLN
jgi:hypothetical protein